MLKDCSDVEKRLEKKFVRRKEMKEAITRYVERGISPGGFLEAVLANDLKESLGRADEDSRESLFEIVKYIYNNWETVRKYMEKKR